MHWARVPTNAGAVDGDINPAVLLSCFLDSCCDGAFINDICLQG